MKAFCCFLFLVVSLLSISFCIPLNNAFAAAITRRHLSDFKKAEVEVEVLPGNLQIEINASFTFPNFRLKKAFAVFQEWKRGILADPDNMLKNWEGSDVCSYNGVFCEKAPDDPSSMTVASIDLNNGNIAGSLAPHLDQLTDLSIFHINSNRFFGLLPLDLSKLTFLQELDISNNGFIGPFPKAVLDLPKLKYLDIRFNSFSGPIPPELFDKDLDAIFLNDNKFSSSIPDNIGNSKASVIVLADNELTGRIPKSIGSMSNLEEIIFANNKLSGCVPEELGTLQNLTVLDLSANGFVGPLPRGLEGLMGVERMDIGGNQLMGKVESICSLPKLANFSFSGNYFEGVEAKCENPTNPGLAIDYKDNCLPNKPNQKPENMCSLVAKRSIDCNHPISYEESMNINHLPPPLPDISPPSPSVQKPSLLPQLSQLQLSPTSTPLVASPPPKKCNCPPKSEGVDPQIGGDNPTEIKREKEVYFQFF